jgi:hypothetical protein
MLDNVLHPQARGAPVTTPDDDVLLRVPLRRRHALILGTIYLVVAAACLWFALTSPAPPKPGSSSASYATSALQSTSPDTGRTTFRWLAALAAALLVIYAINRFIAAAASGRWGITATSHSVRIGVVSKYRSLGPIPWSEFEQVVSLENGRRLAFLPQDASKWTMKLGGISPHTANKKLLFNFATRSFAGDATEFVDKLESIRVQSNAQQSQEPSKPQD